MEFKSTISKFNSPLWGFHFRVPEEIAQSLVTKDSKRVICTLNGSVTFQCAIMPSKDGLPFININKGIRDQLALKVGSEVQVTLKKDESKYGLPMPAEFEELLQQDPDGDRFFHDLTPGKQRSLLYIVGSPKRSETRLGRGIVIVEHLKASQGKIDFRQLNEDMKEANRM